MVQTVTDLNKIFTNQQMTVTNVNVTTLAFNNNKAMMRNQYVLNANTITVSNDVEESLVLYIANNVFNYYEYRISLKNANTIITGMDTHNQTLSGLQTSGILLFINGYHVDPSSYTVVNDNSILIKSVYSEKSISDIIIITSPELEYKGLVTTADLNYDYYNNTFTLADYDYTKYLFFMNNKLLDRKYLTKEDDKVRINLAIDHSSTVIQYYRLPNNITNYEFEETPGYFTYGPLDDFGNKLPILYDTICTFQTIARLAIDDLRKGFFIREADKDGCLMVVDEDFETYDLKCMTIYPFSTTLYTSSEWYCQVPSARSILRYLSQFDLNNTLLPELLQGFQTVVLDEAYDEIQRLNNVRSLYNVSSTEINKALEFMGLKFKINDYSLEKRHEVLEELTSFYKKVGTKASYNQYNLLANNSHIVKLEQLFTPIEDINDANDIIQRYVTFRTAEDLGAEYKKEYVFPVDDYGQVGALANNDDILTNTPVYEGLLEIQEHYDYSQVSSQNHNEDGFYIQPCFVKDDNDKGYRTTSVITEEIVTDEELATDPTIPYVTIAGIRRKINIENNLNIQYNGYIAVPQPGPNKPTEDYGSITESQITDYYDYGLVTDEIKGQWIEWFEWDRPTNWYPTNHCNVAVEVPPDVDYDTFMEEFKNTFYNIASTVLYIHEIIEVYSFGGNGQGGSSSTGSNGGMKMDFVRAPLYESSDYTFTNDPRRQISSNVLD